MGESKRTMKTFCVFFLLTIVTAQRGGRGGWDNPWDKDSDSDSDGRRPIQVPHPGVFPYKPLNRGRISRLNQGDGNCDYSDPVVKKAIENCFGLLLDAVQEKAVDKGGEVVVKKFPEVVDKVKDVVDKVGPWGEGVAKEVLSKAEGEVLEPLDSDIKDGADDLYDDIFNSTDISYGERRLL